MTGVFVKTSLFANTTITMYYHDVYGIVCEKNIEKDTTSGIRR